MEIDLPRMLFELKRFCIISLNGAAAYQGNKDDSIIICTYCDIDQNEVKKHLPKLIYFKDNAN